MSPGDRYRCNDGVIREIVRGTKPANRSGHGRCSVGHFFSVWGAELLQPSDKAPTYTPDALGLPSQHFEGRICWTLRSHGPDGIRATSVRGVRTFTLEEWLR